MNPWWKEPFIINGWHHVLSFLEKLSIFYIWRTVIPNLKKKDDSYRFEKLHHFMKGNYFIIDAWVLVNNIGAFLFVFFVHLDFPLWCKYILLTYGALRVFELFIYQLNVIFVHPYKSSSTTYTLKSYRRMTIMLLHNFIEIICWFAGTYLLFQLIVPKELVATEALSKSFLQMITYNADMGGNTPTFFARTILQLQAVIGVFMTLLSFARFTSLLPKPESLDRHEQEKTYPIEYVDPAMQQMYAKWVEEKSATEILKKE